MNITKGYTTYIPYNDWYKFKCKKYSPIYKCNRVLYQLKEIENNINNLYSISKKVVFLKIVILKYRI